MKLSSAYLLVSHGSRDPRPQAAVERLAQLVCQKLQEIEQPLQDDLDSKVSLTKPGVDSDPIAVMATRTTQRSQFSRNTPWAPLVATACLELSPFPLHQQIAALSDRLVAAGCDRLQVVPLFLLPGTHVKEDIPAEVNLVMQYLQAQAQAQTKTRPSLSIDLLPHLGTHPGLQQLLINQLGDRSDAALILLAHGSRRRGGNQPVEEIAAQVGAVPAYWSVLPSLEMRITELVQAGHLRICIVPYFLFAGGITDAIAQSVAYLAQQFSGVQLELSEVLGVSPALADLVVDLILDRQWK
ncbi:MAG: sirohydrochlorin chelatase [Leptolyngbyaceae bacterium]|nr:sirohydrochlorin chelatase [Leptolyngbyaceae bacterium]